MDSETVDNAEAGRFELNVGGKIAFATYRREDGVLVIRHVEAPPSLRGSGAAGRLMQGVMALARQRGEKIRPLCSYAAVWMRRHREHHDLLV